MNAVNKIEFILRGQVDGVELTPRTIGLSQFNEFNQQVEAFIAGSQREKLSETHVEVGEGSYKLTVLLAAAVAGALEPDLALLAREDTLANWILSEQTSSPSGRLAQKPILPFNSRSSPIDPTCQPSG